MTMCAAHRAILAGRHADLVDHSQSSHRLLQDPDYYIMKSKCIREMNVKIQDPEQSLSDQAIDTVINLITSAVRFYPHSYWLTSLRGVQILPVSIARSWLMYCPDS